MLLPWSSFPCAICWEVVEIEPSARSMACNKCATEYGFYRCARCGAVAQELAGRGRWQCSFCRYQKNRRDPDEEATAAQRAEELADRGVHRGDHDIRLVGGFTLVGGNGFGLAPGSVCSVLTLSEATRVTIEFGELYDAWAAGPLVASGMAGAERWKEAIDGIRATIDYWGEGRTIDYIAPSLAHSPIQRRFWGTLERASMSPGMARALLDAISCADVRPALAAISAPTLVLHHPDAPAIPSEQGRYLAEHIANARYVDLPGPDHAPVGSEMETIADEIQEFLTGTRAAGRPNRVLVTVLFTDIVESTRRATELGDHDWRELLERHDALVRSQLERFGGREVKQTGDGFLASFDGPTRAIRCARSIGEEARELGIEIRAGLHSGECELIGDDLGGVAVHVAARVGAMARPGEVLVSGTLKDLVMGSGIDLVDRGAHELKGVPGEWRLFAVRDDAGPLRAVATGSQPMPDERLRIADRATWRVVRQAPGLVRAGARVLRRRSTKD
jgi:class 3 adenylate cyclase/DNA-directed RNA polymerase subunit RPC12/RpoP